MFKETVVAHFKTLSRNSFGDTNETHEESQSVGSSAVTRRGYFACEN
jgi:hypothetical protein